MNRIVKLSIISLMIISMIFCIVKISYATLSSNVTITSVSEVEKGEEFTVRFNLSNLKSDKGINVLIGKLKYDKDSLELIKMEGQNEWSKPDYNEADGTFLVDREEYIATDGAFMKITFKVKQGSKKNISISIEKVSLSNEDEEIDVSSTSKSITVKGNSQYSNTNTNTNVNTNTNTSSNSSTNTNSNSSVNLKPVNSTSGSVKNEKLPDTGVNSNKILIPFIVVVIITILIAFLGVRSNNKR